MDSSTFKSAYRLIRKRAGLLKNSLAVAKDFDRIYAATGMLLICLSVSENHDAFSEAFGIFQKSLTGDRQVDPEVINFFLSKSVMVCASSRYF